MYIYIGGLMECISQKVEAYGQFVLVLLLRPHEIINLEIAIKIGIRILNRILFERRVEERKSNKKRKLFLR